MTHARYVSVLTSLLLIVAGVVILVRALVLPRFGVSSCWPNACTWDVRR